MEWRSGWYGGSADQRRRLVFGVLARPLGNDLIALGLALDAGGGFIVARIADQLLAPDQFQQTRPMLGIGRAGQQIDVVVGPAGLARKDPRRRIAAGRPTRRGLAGLCLSDEHAAAVMHDRILHRRLQTPALAGGIALVERADDAERESMPV